VQKTAQSTRLGKQEDVFHFRTGPAAGCSHRRIMAEVKSRIDGWWNEMFPPEVISE
jgi:hypothetical protein